MANDQTEPTTTTEPEVTAVPAKSPDFTAITPNAMGQMFLANLYDAHANYVGLFDRVYPSVDKLPRVKAWADSLPSVATVDIDGFDVDPNDASMADLYDVARLSPDAATVATVRRLAIALADKAWENLQGIHAATNATRTPLVGTADASGVEAARLQVANYLKMAAQMAAAGCIPEGSHWSILPNRQTDGGRTVYDGPSLPTSRKVNLLRANTKRLAIMVDGKPAGTAERRLDENVKDVLRLDMAELKALVGDFMAENHGVEFTSPNNGVRFSLTIRDGAEDEPEDDEVSEGEG